MNEPIPLPILTISLRVMAELFRADGAGWCAQCLTETADRLEANDATH